MSRLERAWGLLSPEARRSIRRVIEDGLYLAVLLLVLAALDLLVRLLYAPTNPVAKLVLESIEVYGGLAILAMFILSTVKELITRWRE